MINIWMVTAQSKEIPETYDDHVYVVGVYQSEAKAIAAAETWKDKDTTVCVKERFLEGSENYAYYYL